MPQILSDRIIFDANDWTAGLHPQYAASTPGIQKGGGLASAASFDPFRFLGYASVGMDAAAAEGASVVTTVLRSITSYSATSAYCISGGALLHELNPAMAIITTTGGIFPHTISPHGGHQNAVGSDSVIYNANIDSVLTKQLFYSWNDGTDGDIGTFNFITTFDDDFMSTVPSGKAVLNITNQHPMIVGDRNILYIGDGGNVHQYDGQTGANGTFTKNALELGNDYIITSFAKFQKYLIIFATTEMWGRGISTVFFWNYFDDFPSEIFQLGDGNCDGGFVYQNTVGCFLYAPSADRGNASRRGRMLLYDGSRFKEQISFLANIPIYRGVDINGDIIYWNSQGTLYSFGSPFKGVNSGLNILCNLLGSTSGALKNINGITYSSSGTAASGGMEQLNGRYQTGGGSTSMAFPNFPKDKCGKITRVDIIFGQLATAGRSFTLQLRNNDNELSQINTAISTIAAGSLIQKFTTKSDGSQFDTFVGLSAILNWAAGTDNNDAPLIDKIIVYFDAINYNSL